MSPCWYPSMLLSCLDELQTNLDLTPDTEGLPLPPSESMTLMWHVTAGADSFIHSLWSSVNVGCQAGPDHPRSLSHTCPTVPGS